MLSLRKKQVFVGEIRRHNLMRHWLRVHKTILTKEKTIQTGKFRNCHDLKSARELIVKYHIKCNLYLSTWDSEEARDVFDIYSTAFGLNLSAASMHSYIIDEYKQIRDAISKRLKNRMFSIQLDIASRKGRALLGITAQFISG